MSDTPAFSPWWGSFDLPPGSAARWRLGPAEVVISHRRNEWRVCRRQVPLGESDQCRVDLGLTADQVEQEIPFGRYVATPGSKRLRIEPRLPDRSVVVRPEHPITVPPRGEVTVFVGVPLWLRLEEEEGTTLVELPPVPPKLTWWGDDTRSGSTCYASRTSGRLRLEEIVSHPHRATTAARIVNRSHQPLLLERLNLPVRQLGLYVGSLGGLWSETVVLERRAGQDEATLELGGEAPSEALESKLLCGPREAQGLKLFRAFGSLFR